MVQKNRDKRNYVIGALLLLVLFMTVGFAAFRTTLTINGTAAITSNWCVGFDNRNDEAYEITKGLSTGTNPSASMTFSGTACESNYVPNSTLTANFYQPGDKVEYTLTIANKSSMTAAIESIEVNGSSVTSNQTITDGNIIWKVYMPETTTLASNATTTMVVSAEFQNTTDISNMTQGDSSSLTVGINVVQDDGTGGFTSTAAKYSGTVYAWNTTSITIGTSTINDLTSTKTANPYYTSESAIQSALSGKTGSTIYNKYTVVNDLITEGYSCQTFGVLSTAECVKMSTDGSAYGYDTGGNHTNNAGILKALQSNSTFTGASGICYFDSNNSTCDAGGLILAASSSGIVGAHDDVTNAICDVYYNGIAICDVDSE